MSEPKKYREFWLNPSRQQDIIHNFGPIGSASEVEPQPGSQMLHVVEISALHEAEEKIDELEIQVHHLKNTSPVEALRALREVDKMKLDRANEMLEKMAAALEMRKYHDEDCADKDEPFNKYETCECGAQSARQALKEYEEFNNLKGEL